MHTSSTAGEFLLASGTFISNNSSFLKPHTFQRGSNLKIWSSDRYEFKVLLLYLLVIMISSNMISGMLADLVWPQLICKMVAPVTHSPVCLFVWGN